MTDRPKPPNAGKGRPRGIPNKTTMAVRDALTEAFDRLGGVDSLVHWGKANPDLFYPLWAKLLPKEMVATVDGNVVLRVATMIGQSPEDSLPTISTAGSVVGIGDFDEEPAEHPEPVTIEAPHDDIPPQERFTEE
jgi:hypothetical protein